MEIKFKAEYKKVIYDVVAIYIGIKVILKKEKGLMFEVDLKDCKLLQFSGEQDVNGNDIYAGHIVDMGDYGVKEIKFYEGAFGFFHRYGDFISFASINLFFLKKRRFEIIGDISKKTKEVSNV